MRLPRLTRERAKPRDQAGDLAAGARAMRATLDSLHAELELVNGRSAPVDLRAIVGDLLEGEVEAPTPDVADLVRRGTDPEEFYRRELAPSWEELGEAQRAARLKGFLDLADMLASTPAGAAGIPPEMAATVHTKALLLAWAFDETYGYVARLGRGERPSA